MASKCLCAVPAAFLVLLAADSSRADEITLNNGNVIEGRIVRESTPFVQIRNLTPAGETEGGAGGVQCRVFRWKMVYTVPGSGIDNPCDVNIYVGEKSGRRFAALLLVQEGGLKRLDKLFQKMLDSLEVR
jgi:hypothetical protein